jgi:hypothetical protein
MELVEHAGTGRILSDQCAIRERSAASFDLASRQLGLNDVPSMRDSWYRYRAIIRHVGSRPPRIRAIDLAHIEKHEI